MDRTLGNATGEVEKHKLKCPLCTLAFTSGGETKGLVPRILKPCGCAVCTTCGASLHCSSLHTFF